MVFSKEKRSQRKRKFTVSEGGTNTCVPELFANDPIGMIRSAVGAGGYFFVDA